MKNIYGIDITENKENTVVDGAQYITRTVSPAQRQRIEEAQKSKFEMQKHVMSGPVTILNGIALIAGIGFFVRLRSLLDDLSFLQAIRQSPMIFLGLVVSFLLVVGIPILTVYRSKKFQKSEEFDSLETQEKLMVNASHAELGVPSDAQKIDVFYRFYKMKNDELKNATAFYQYDNGEVEIFVRDACFCLASLEQLVSIPLSEIRGITKINKRVTMANWNKDENFDSKKYKKYKITENNAGSYVVKPCYALAVCDSFEILIPSYDIETVTSLLNFDISLSEAN